MAKANVLKLLKFDQDLREAVTAGRRLRGCTLINANAPKKKSELKGKVCFIGVEEISRNSSFVVAGAVAIASLNWYDGLKTEMERLHRGNADAARNELSEALLSQTVWGTGLVVEEQTHQVGRLKAAQIAMHMAIDHVIQKLKDEYDNIVIVVDENKTIAESQYPQMSLGNASERSICVAAAQVVAESYRELVINASTKRAPAPIKASATQDFSPPADEAHIESYLKHTPAVQVFPQ